MGSRRNPLTVEALVSLLGPIYQRAPDRSIKLEEACANALEGTDYSASELNDELKRKARKRLRLNREAKGYYRWAGEGALSTEGDVGLPLTPTSLANLLRRIYRNRPGVEIKLEKAFREARDEWKGAAPLAKPDDLKKRAIRILTREHPLGFVKVPGRRGYYLWEAEVAANLGGSLADTLLTTAPDNAALVSRIDQDLAEIRENVAQDLLRALREKSPAFFEALVLELLGGLGYGQRPGTRTGGPGDGGVDGFVSLDPLGLDKVYVQAKRYGDGNTVGEPDIRDFFGALEAKRATKGVIFTLSHFSNPAIKCAKKLGRMVLVDGAAFARYMIDSGVGVDHHVYRVPRVDSDYFAEAEYPT